MKSFSSTVVKDILSSPLGEDPPEEEEWPVNLDRREPPTISRREENLSRNAAGS